MINISLLKQYLGKQIQSQGSVFVFRQVFSQWIRPVKGNLISWASITKKQQKMNLCYTNSLKQSRFSSIDCKKGAPKRDRMFVVFILSNVFELHARLVTPLTFEPITSAVIWKIHYSNLCIRFRTWWERRMNQPPLQRRIVRQTLPNLMLLPLQI